MKRRFILPGLFLLVLVTPFFLRLFVGAASSSPASAGAAPLIIITSHTEGIRREFADAFREYHKKKYGQDVAIDYISYASNDIVKLFQDREESTFPKLKTYQIDVIWGGGDFVFDVLLKKYLKGVTLDPQIMAAAFPSPTLNGLALYDAHNKPPHWYGAAMSSFGITYNRDVLRYLKLPEPTTWADLKAPAYRNWVIAADPSRSASAKSAFMAIVERAMADSAAHGESEDIGWARGMGLVRQIAANARIFTDGSSTVPGIIASGDGAAGMTIDFYGRSQVEAIESGRLGYIQPAGATIINPDPIGMAVGAENSVVAQRFIEFVLSKQGQNLWNKRAGTPGGPKSTNLRRLPIMPSVYNNNADFVDKDLPFTSTGGFNKSDAREKTFSILGELIQASCMNCLDELRETRADILASPRAVELDAKLGIFPYDQKEALKRAAAYKAADPVKQLELMRQWTAEFQAEYKTLRDEAAGQ